MPPESRIDRSREPVIERVEPVADSAYRRSHMHARLPWTVVSRGVVLLLVLLAVLGIASPVLADSAQPRPPWHPGPPWAPLAPQSSEMHRISDLFWVMLILSAVVFVAVSGLLLVAIVRYTARPGGPEPKQTFGNRTVEVTWTLIPCVVLAVAFVFTVSAIHSINSPEKGQIMNIEVVGHQWWWEFRYPVQPGISSPVVTANELHLPTGSNIHFHITSADVIHSFWTPQIQRQVDANPGHDNAVYVKLDNPGSYAGDCYEYCGTAHAWMKYRVVVQTPVQFSAWLRGQQAPGANSSASTAAYGKKVFLGNTCVNCHAVEGTSAGGAVGPNLTHVGSRWAVGAGAAPMSQRDLETWIKSPTTYKPGVLMPGYPLLSSKDIHALAAYLLSLK